MTDRNNDDTIVTAEIKELPIGTSLVPVTTSKGLDLIEEHPALPDILIQEAIEKGDADRMVAVIALIEKWYPQAAKPTGKLHHFEWPQVTA